MSEHSSSNKDVLPAVQQHQENGSENANMTEPQAKRPSTVLGTIKGQQTDSGRLDEIVLTGTFEDTDEKHPVDGLQRDRIQSHGTGAAIAAAAAAAEEEGEEALRSRANTAPVLSTQEMNQIAAISSPSTAPKENSQGEAESPQTDLSGNQEDVSFSEEDEDEEIRIAKAMALAIQSNPNLTPEEIRELVGVQQQQQQQDLVAVKQQQQAQTPQLLIPGRLTSMFATAAAAASATTAFTEEDTTSQQQQQPSLSSSSKGKSRKKFGHRMTEMLTKMTSEHDVAAAAAATTTTVETPTTVLTKQDSVSSGLRLPFRPASSKNLRSPPVSPNATLAAAVEVPAAASSSPGEGVATTTTTTTATIKADASLALPLTTDNDAASTTAAPPATTLAAATSAASASSTYSKSPKSAPIRLAGVAFKRRGGMGKYSVTGAWERRRIELQGTKLLYYRDLEEADGTNLTTTSPTNSRDEVSVSANNSMSSLQQPEDGSSSSKDAANATEGVVVTRRATWFEQAAANWNQNAATEDPTEPRGYMDLAKEKATVQAAFGHSGAPSPFALSIKVRGETKWKLCFDAHETQMEWLAAITDIVVQTSVDQYNASLLEAADPANQTEASTLFHPPAVQEPPAGGQDAAAVHRLWMMGTYSIANKASAVRDDEDVEKDLTEAEATDREAEIMEIGEADASAAVSVENTMAQTTAAESATKKWFVPEKNLLYLSGLLNFALACARASSTTLEGFWYIVAFSNLGLFLCLVKEPDWRSILQYVRALPPAQDKIRRAKAVAEKKVAKKPKPPSYIPVAGCSTIKLKEPTDPPVNSKDEFFGAWRSMPGDILMVRSHGYLSTKKKVPSPGSLFDCAHVDIFESPSRYPDMGPRVKLPKVEFDDGGQPKTWRTPDTFIISIALPTDPPKMTRTSSDGGGYTVTLYYTMTQETRDILRRVTADGYDPSQEKVDDPQKSQINAVRLFEEWCRRAPTDPKFQARFKIVPNAHNLKEIGMPGWISKYNGKPFLIKRPGVTGFLYSHPELSCMEFDVSLHPFPYLAKHGICFMKESYFKRILVTFGFVIEGRADDELPECLIGLTQLCYPDPAYAIQAADFFSGAAPRSF